METENSDGTQTTITQGPSGNSHILHVRQDSASELEAMFKTALNPNFKSKTLPMKSRNLPKSFFQQPDRPRGPPMHSHSKSMGHMSGLVSMPSSISHSRSSSTDSSASHHSNISHGMNNVNQNSSVGINQGVIGHRQTFTPGPSQRRLINQNKVNTVPQHGNMQAVHSRSKSLPVSLNPNMFKSAQLHSSGTIEIPPDMPLPPNWEMAKTPDGQCYFMNHNTRSTTWEDPRIAIIKEQQQQNRSSDSSPHHSPMHAPNNINQSETLGALPPGWEQSMTQQGEVYFINHETRSTSWLDPRLQQANLNTQAAAPPQMTVNTQLQQQVHKMNQLDIGQQGLFGQQPPRGLPMMKQLAKERDAHLKMRLMKQVGTGMDPFLGSSSNYHEREQSCDSGVGGMGTNYSPLRASSEDYLGHVEEMDTGEARNASANRNQMSSGNHSSSSHPASSTQQRFPDFLDGLPSSNVDFSASNVSQVPTGDHTQVANAGLSGEDATITESDFMNDVESMLSPVKSENIDTMTWL